MVIVILYHEDDHELKACNRKQIIGLRMDTITIQTSSNIIGTHDIVYHEYSHMIIFMV